MDTEKQNPEPEKQTSEKKTPQNTKNQEHKNDIIKPEIKSKTDTDNKDEFNKDKSGDKSHSGVITDKIVITKILEKFPIFKGLTAFQYQQILNICSIKTFEKEQLVCQESDESNEMYILISGKLDVMFHKKTVLNSITPISLVGELVFFTGEQGFSSVIASENSTVVSIHKNNLFQLLKRDCALSYIILMNVIKELVKKLRTNDEVIDQLKKK
ncbi:Crp/Fnr family transcriptional regulator [Candidatus Latescibacterota bacterium]